MNTILKFDPRPVDRQTRQPDHEGSAEIILFPGVRYERKPDGAAKAIDTSGRKEG